MFLIETPPPRASLGTESPRLQSVSIHSMEASTLRFGTPVQLRNPPVERIGQHLPRGLEGIKWQAGYRFGLLLLFEL